ncbi:MAG: hypothetical protein HZA14_05860 [Nitrospirae bacterium]|nr:hypothetical protein [Nitrospirota bacterium]
MEGPINKSVFDRLPSAIKPLDETSQKVYICLRLRKPEHEISRQLNLSLNETSEKIRVVRNELIRAGQLDLIEDPRFVSIHAEDPDSREFPLAADGLDIDKRLIIKEFLLCLKQSVNDLPEHQSQILKLRYKYQLSAKDILGFCRKMELSVIPDKELSAVKEQDVFYALNTALREVLKNLKSRYEGDNSFGMENLKYIFEEIGL